MQVKRFLTVLAVLVTGASIFPEAIHAQDTNRLLAHQLVTDQQAAIPSYIYPSWNQTTNTLTGDWGQMAAESGSNGPVGLNIINPNSGPGTAKDPNYAAAVTLSQSAGITVIGYVHTSYGARSLKTVEGEINRYLAWYPTLNGIFFDEVATGKSKVSYYTTLVSYLKKNHSGGVAVLNPGTTPDEGYLKTAKADILVTFESDYTTYVSGYTTASWVSKYPSSRFWHIVYSAATVADMQNAVTLSQNRNAGYVYVTTLGLPNPYGALPDNPFWTDELTAIGG